MLDEEKSNINAALTAASLQVGDVGFGRKSASEDGERISVASERNRWLSGAIKAKSLDQNID